MEKIDSRIVPETMIVGVNRHLCYVTYEETKGKKTDLNSKASWEGWRDKNIAPIHIKNEFANGFKLAGVNGRWSSNARNADNLLIEHPLFGYCFELGMGEFLEIIKDCTILNGVIDKELIMDKHRNLLTKKEYKKAIKAQDYKEAKEAEKVAKLKGAKIPTKDQKVGHRYKDAKSGTTFLYMGTINIYEHNQLDSEPTKKYVYLNPENNKFQEVKAVKSWYDREQGKRIVEGTYYKTFPGIIYASGSYDEVKRSIYWYTSVPSYRLSVVKNKRQVSALPNGGSDKDWFDEYTDEDWETIKKVYETKDDFETRYNYDDWAKKDANWKTEIKFKEDYKAQS